MSNAAVKYDLSAPDSPLPAAALRRWLHGRWALLFSHANDFAAYGFESDRWLVHVQEAFAAADVRPLALADRQEAGWVTEVGGCTTTLALDRSTRFVMTLDASLRPRRTFAYTQQDRLPSPIDLVALARQTRDRSLTGWAAARNRPAIPCRR
ncbi:MAG TPA: hypothetical protein VJT80_24430 [Steroidobacteraceae bacterium]|nr:hypothetical protein [Steroidobacteraceae bacterium]